MRPMVVIAARSLGRIIGQTTSVFAATVFIAVTGALFANGLFSAEGTAVSLPSVWSLAVANVLPLLASLLTMRLWSEDGVVGRTELDLVAPVPERAFAIGRFAAAYIMVSLMVVVALAIPLLVLPHCAPALTDELTVVRFLPALAALLILALPLTAIGSLASVCFGRAASAAVASVALTYVLPYAAYRALIAWSVTARMKFAESPLLAQLADASDGFFSVGAAVVAMSFAAFAIYAASKIFTLRRLVGGGRFVFVASTWAAVFSSLLAATLLAALAVRMDAVVEWPGASRTAAFSARTRGILSEVPRKVRVTACIRRDSPLFLPLSRLLRALSAEAQLAAGAGVACEFVDPRWDPNAAMRLLSRTGAGEGAIVFSVGKRRIVVSAKDIDESACASAIQRLSMPVKSEKVLFTAGHGEPSMDDYGPAGLSDAARALRQDGYQVGVLNSTTSSIPGDCAVVAVVGARTPFSAAELRDFKMFLSQGGRIIAAVSADANAGIGALLNERGVEVSADRGAGQTTDGSDMVVTAFGDHAISRPLEGSAVVFAADSLRFAMPPAGERGDGFVLAPLCTGGKVAYALAIERGIALKSDLAIRPARMVVIGDPSFFLNGALVSRANANRDFFLNSVAWLAGLDVSGSAGIAGNVLSARMDRRRRIRFFALSVCVVPAAFAAMCMIVVLRRRRAQ